jgi:PIN domain nuclease of toxin-antitoxin system
MRLLLDTHIALWALIGSEKLGEIAEKLLLNGSNEVFVSAATVWEISIKHGLGRGDVPVSGERALELFALAGYRELAVTQRHAALVETLPAIHADPFDRILVAQATAEGMALLTRDAAVIRYGAMVVPV